MRDQMKFDFMLFIFPWCTLISPWHKNPFQLLTIFYFELSSSPLRVMNWNTFWSVTLWRVQIYLSGYLSGIHSVLYWDCVWLRLCVLTFAVSVSCCSFWPIKWDIPRDPFIEGHSELREEEFIISRTLNVESHQSLIFCVLFLLNYFSMS